MVQKLKETMRGLWEFARSTSQRRTYRSCGYKYLLQYAFGWKPRFEKGSYEFGHVMERLATVIAIGWVTDAAEAAALFRYAWWLDASEFEWTKTQGWEFFLDRGQSLAKLLVKELPSHFDARQPVLCQETINFEVGMVPEVAIPDYYGHVRQDMFSDFLPTVLDFKTGASAFVSESVELDEQLTDYQLAEWSKGRPVAQLCLCVMVYTADPKVQWLFAQQRDTSVIDRFVQTAQSVDAAIKAEVFFQNDRACFTMGTCPFVPLCYPSKAVERDTKLVRETPRRKPEDVFTGWD